MSVAYLGPRGTFTEEALRAAGLDKDGIPLQTVAAVVQAVSDGTATNGLVPIENSIEGSVNVTLDELAFNEEGVEIVGEIVLPIRHSLLGLAKTGGDSPKHVVSHPHAAAQCRQWLEAHVPGAEVHAANSTAEAARTVAKKGDPSWVAIGTQLAGEIYGLQVKASDIEDRSENSTRFVLLGRERPEPTGSDKSSLVCFIEKDRPGSLLAILHEFSDRQINLSKLESRPTKERLGEYCFFIDAEGHCAEPPLSFAIQSLGTKIFRVKILGCYQRLDITNA